MNTHYSQNDRLNKFWRTRGAPSASPRLLQNLVAAAGLALVVASADATLVYTDGDLFLGFRASAPNPGSSTTYVVDLGSFSSFTNSTHVTLSIGNTANDLAAAFGPNWATDGTVSWGGIGAFYNAGLTPILWATKARTDINTPATAFTLPANNSAQQLIGSAVKNLGLFYQNSGSATGNSSVGTFLAASDTASFSTQTSGGTNDFQGPASWNIDGPLTSGGAGNVLDLFQARRSAPSGVTRIGTFSIDNTGSIDFTGTAVPEPSSALLATAGLAALVAGRRRQQQRRDQAVR